MRHPTEGVLRRLLDEPAGVADADRSHAAACPECAGGLAVMREDAALVDAALVAGVEDAADVDVDAAWRRLATAVPATGPGRAALPSRGRRFGTVLRRPAVAGVAVAVVLAGAGTAAANDWFQVFRTEQVAPVGISTADLNALPDLSAYGDVAPTGDPDVREVADAATAAAETGLAVPEVAELPRGVEGEPSYQVGDEVGATFTFSAERAAEAAADVGEALPPPPPGVDGSQVSLVAGPAVAQVWTQQAGVPSLLVGRAVAPTAFASGAPFETVRAYLLGLPGLPEDVAAQLRSLGPDGSTLPLPVPEDEVETSSEQVGGVPATVLTTRDRTLAAVLWVEDGVVTAVVGALDADEVLTIARSLR
jgi:hypothetical protein